MNASSSFRTNPGSEPARSLSRSQNAGQCSLAHKGEGVPVLGVPRNVARLGMTAGHCTALLMGIPGR